MSEKEYLYYFTPDRNNRFRYYHSLESGNIVRFSIQYEAFIAGNWHPIVRYDSAHNRPNKDLLHPDGSQEKIEFYGYSREEVLTIGERDIKNRWQDYRLQYIEEMNRNV